MMSDTTITPNRRYCDNMGRPLAHGAVFFVFLYMAALEVSDRARLNLPIGDAPGGEFISPARYYRRRAL